jgi:hypothetical protein
MKKTYKALQNVEIPFSSPQDKTFPALPEHGYCL